MHEHLILGLLWPANLHVYPLDSLSLVASGLVAMLVVWPYIGRYYLYLCVALLPPQVISICYAGKWRIVFQGDGLSSFFIGEEYLIYIENKGM